MNRTLLTLLVICCHSLSYSQEKQERILYIVDSIPIYDDPDDEDQIVNNDIYNLEVITNSSRLKALGYEGKFEKIMMLTTKAYAARSAELKKIATTKLMEKKEGRWYNTGSDSPFSGKFIDYFMSGKIQGEGVLKEGVIEGIRTVYYPNGNKRHSYTYENGIENGESKEYFLNGRLRQQGNFLNKKEAGLWQIYYSSGKLKLEINYVNNKQVLSKEQTKFLSNLNKGASLMKDGDFKGAIKKLDEAQALNPEYADVYFYRGTARLNNMDFDNAVVDFDKAIEMEPLYMEALGNRAFTRIRKYEFKDGRTLSSNKEVTIMATKDKVPIPDEDLDKIRADLKLCYELGDRKPMILDAISRYGNDARK
ncbi:MAG TPA: hypothetical protein VK541_06710 [Pedobacter sp.]|uniref:hypothetical protein n=1 Tax=Pedobacter sp. TaxID=1411316 RepID=UPI002CE072C8|nr:hypothetical protein [Pedobacter sp.]HMI02153.1 hypothetical protein [Pedobacter sp.]